MRAVTALFLCASLAAAQEKNVIVLLRTQLLGDAKAYGAFVGRNGGRKRSELRKETIEKLKRIAADEQPALLKALGSPADARSLWLVNAIALRLGPEKIRKAKELRSVKFIYASGPLPADGPAGTVAEVLEQEPRGEFTTRKKTIPWNLKMLKAPEVWKTGVLGEGVVVAMFDVGVNYRHTDLRNNMWMNRGEVANNGKDDDGNGYVDDLYGFDFSRNRAEVQPGRIAHGTMTASVVAGDGSGGQITGVAPRARLMALRGNGTYNAARAFQYALDMGADVVNMSFSIPDLGNGRGLWRLMAEQATCAGLVLVSGAGNFPSLPVPVQIRIPEGIPSVICAGGVTKKRKFARLSRGPVEWESVEFYGDYPMPKGLIKPDVCAFPGPGIGLVAAGDSGYLPENNGKRGNSLSSPHVSGVCALMLSVNPELNAWRVKEILEATATDLRPRGKDVKTGAGLVNALKAVKAVKAVKAARGG